MSQQIKIPSGGVVETWSFSATIASGQQGLANYCTIQRTPGAVTIATSTTPFFLPASQKAQMVDLYVVASQTPDALVDVVIDEVSQRAALELNARLPTNAGRKHLARPFTFDPNSSIRIVAYPLSNAAGTITFYGDVLVAT